MSTLFAPRPENKAHSPSERPLERSPPHPFFKNITPARNTTQAAATSTMLQSPSPLRPGPLVANTGSPMDVEKIQSNGAVAVSRPHTDDTLPGGIQSPNNGRSSSSSSGGGGGGAISGAPTAHPRIEVKTELPPSPSPAPASTTSARRRPQKLDLNTNTIMPPGRLSAPLTAKDSGGLSAMHDVATACLSPGFDTSDPAMRSQMERSRDLADKQRQLIAARQNRGVRERDVSASKGPADLGPPPSSFSKPLGTSRRKAPPSMLSLNAAAGGHYSEPRVIQSAPINQTFTGLHRPAHPLSRQVLEHSHQHSHSQQHQQHAMPHPGQQYPRFESRMEGPPTVAPHSGRLPPISDLVRPGTSLHDSPHLLASEITGFRPPLRRSNSGQERSNGQAASHDTVHTRHAQNGSSPLTPAHPPDGRFPPMQRAGPDRDVLYATHVNQSISSPIASTYPSNGGGARYYARPGDRSKSSSEERRLAEKRRSGDYDMLNAPRPQNSASSPIGNSHSYKPSPGQLSGFPPNYFATTSAASVSARRPEHDQRLGGEEIAQSIEGRDELQPKPLPYGMYGGRQPPTPNSPLPPIHAMKSEMGGAGRRRTRDEYERDHDTADADERDREQRRRQAADAGLGFGFGTWTNTSGTRNTPETMRRKREEFISICARAWDLLHE